MKCVFGNSQNNGFRFLKSRPTKNYFFLEFSIFRKVFQISRKTKKSEIEKKWKNKMKLKIAKAQKVSEIQTKSGFYGLD